MFGNTLNMQEKIFIIQHANLDDVTILHSNYMHLARKEFVSPEEHTQFVILQKNTETRIKELTQ